MKTYQIFASSRGGLRACVALTGLTMALAFPSIASAQAQPAAENADDQQATDNPDIVVTGTLVRGVAPPGASPIAVSSEDIRSTGVTSVAQLLQTVPQLGSFGQFQIPLANSAEVSTNRPNLRDLPGNNTAGGSTTLVLLDGHRIVGMGNGSTNADPDIIPPGVIERVEIVPDGGSSIYGSDAVAGVINFITLRRFDGVKVDGSYGFADNYYRYSGNITAGRDWGSGSLFVSYNYSKSDELLGSDRDYIRQFPGFSGAGTGLLTLGCGAGNITTQAGAYGTPAGRVIGLPAGVATAPNQCDISDNATVYPGSKRHSVFAGLTQELSDGLTFELRGFYTHRDTISHGGPFRFSQILVPQPLTAALVARGVPAISSPFSTVAFGGIVNGSAVFVPNSPNTVDLVQQVDFQFGPNDSIRSNISLDTWGLAPTFTADLDSNFQLRVLASYGESIANFTARRVNEGALRNAIRAGLFNPFAASTASTDLVNTIGNFQDYNRTRQFHTDLRAVVDGDLMQLPAGAVKVAVGLEYANEQFHSQNGQSVPGFENSGFTGQSIGTTLVVPAHGALPRFNVGRSVRSAFGELVVPVLGGEGSPQLTVSAAGRYDDYSDVGGTFNPRFGATFRPVPWISLRGAWGKSFNAPSLADQQAAGITTAFVLSGASASFFAPPASLVGTGAGKYPAYTNGLIVALRGNAPNIQPQKATTYSFGFDIDPPFIPGLSFGATYYNISFNNLIGLAPFQSPALLYRDYGNLITIAPSQAVIDSALAQANVINGPTSVTASTVYAYFDARKTNLGDVRVDGIDLRFSYRATTGFGELFTNVNGTYELNREQSSQPGASFVDVLSNNTSRFRLRSTAGAQVGPVLGQVTWNHRAGYGLDPVVGFVPQNRVNAFDTVDLYFRAEVGGTGLGENLAFTLNVENVLDTAPPEFRGGDQVSGRLGTQNGSTLGRLVTVGVSKKF